MRQSSQLLLASLILSGCQMTAESVLAADPVTIGLSVASLQNDIFNQIKQAVEKAGNDMGAIVIIRDAKDDGATQSRQVQDLVNQKIQALIYIPAGAPAAAVPVKIAKAAGIPVVAVDRNPIDAPGDTFVATGNVAAATALGEYACKMMDGKADLQVIESPLHTRHEDERNRGFVKAMDDCPGITEVWRDWTNTSSPEEGFSYAQKALLQYSNISLIFGRVDTLALGAARAVEAAHLDHKVFVIGFDGDVAALQAVKDGRLAATMTQRTRLMGTLALQSALDLIAGRTVPAEQMQDAVLTTRDNVDQVMTTHP